MNYSDSERVGAVLEKTGYEKTEAPEDTDLYIFNTCSIRQKGEDRVLGTLKRLSQQKKANPRLLVGLTGCMVRNTSSRNSEKEIKDELLKKLDSIDFVFKIIDTHKIPEVLAEAEPQLDIPQLDEVELNDYLKIKPNYTSKFQAFVPIQIGCDKYCTYCIVPYSRGREKSRPLTDILQECRALVENGCKEITLVGQTVNSYGLSALDKQNPEFANAHELPFIKLLKEINALSELGLDRLRYTSPHPRDMSDELIEAQATLKTLCPYIHLPVQSGDNAMLQRMNRKYTVEHYQSIIKKIREKIPNCAISTDIIVGYSNETNEQFENTCKLYDEVGFDMCYLARYSPRPGTVAYKAFPDDVSREEKARRWHILNKTLEKHSLRKHEECLDKTLEILVEKFDVHTNECEGRSREFKVVQFTGSEDLIGQIVPVKITQASSWFLKGELK